MLIKELTKGNRKVLITSDHKEQNYHLRPFFYIEAISGWMAEEYQEPKEIHSLREAKQKAKELLNLKN